MFSWGRVSLEPLSEKELERARERAEEHKKDALKALPLDIKRSMPCYTERDWSKLPSEILDVLPFYLTFDPDLIRFRSVCSSWRSTARKPQLLPWIIGHLQDDQGDYTVPTLFAFSFWTKIYPLELPESPSSLFSGRQIRWLGSSSHRWLSLLDLAAPAVVLWNPVTRSQIHLPTLPFFPTLPTRKGFVYSKITTADDRAEYYESYIDRGTGEEVIETLSLEQAQNYLASQVILSSDPAAAPSDLVALAVCGFCSMLAFCRPGDQVWTLLQCPVFPGRSARAIFYKGKFYVASGFTVYVCDLEGSNPTVAKLVSLNPSCCSFSEGQIEQSYLVESNDDLLLVLSPGSAFTAMGECDSEVYKICRGEEELQLLKVVTLGDMALFLGSDQCFSLAPATKFHPNLADCICYSEIRLFVYYKQHMPLRTGNWQDGTLYTLMKSACRRGWKPCGWFKPDLFPYAPNSYKLVAQS